LKPTATTRTRWRCIDHHKCPTSVGLTRTATGKLQKFLLRAPYWEGRERKVN
jgi:hypothetical protein